MEETSSENFIVKFFNGIGKFIIPLLLGLIIWIISTMYYGGLITGNYVELTTLEWIGYIILYFVVWIIAILLAVANQNIISFILYIVGSWITGFLESNIVIWSVLDEGLGIDEAKNLLFMCTIIACVVIFIATFIGAYLRENTSIDTSSIGTNLIIFGFMIIVIEPIIIIRFGFDKYIIITSIIVILWTLLGAIHDGMSMFDKLDGEEDQWMLMTISVFLSIIIMAIRLFIIFAKSKK